MSSLIHRRVPGVAFAVPVVLAIGALLHPAPALAQTRASEARYTGNVRGDLTMAANNLLTCKSGATSGGVTCEQARARQGVPKNNNAYVMEWIDADDSATTFNSSAASLSLPAGADVRWAGLYWTCTQLRGEAPPDPARFAEVRLRTPARAYSTITATTVDDGIPSTSSQGAPLMALADVTEAVREGGAGAYWVADVQCARGATGLYGGWALVVAYASEGTPLRNLTVFDVYEKLSRGAEVEFPVQGFVTPATGRVQTRVGFIAGEGDQASADRLFINANGQDAELGDAPGSLNPAGDVANGTISTDGASVTTRVPADANTFGFDADFLDADDALPNRASDATIVADADVESLVLGVVTFATDVDAPELVAIKTATDVNGAPLRATDTIEYTLEVTNEGFDRAVDIVLVDEITSLVTLVPGSIELDGTVQTEAVDGDETDWNPTTRRLTIRLAEGIGLAHNDTSLLSFRVKVNPDPPAGAVVANQATLDYAGDTLGTLVRYATRSDADPALDGLQPTLVVATNARARLLATKTAALTADRNRDGDVDPGDEIAFDLSVRNQGDAPATDVVLTDPIDPLLDVVRVRTNQGTVTSGLGSPVRVELGTVAPGGAPSVTIYANVRRPFALGVDFVSNQAVVEASNAPRIVSDDTGTVVSPDSTRVNVDGSCDCFIGDRCWTANERNPRDFCEVCSPGSLATRWSPVQSDTCDADGDRIPDTIERPDGATRDTDNDGTPDHLDLDDDGDGIPTRREADDDATTNDDTDGDGTPSWLDTDADGDGAGDRDEGTGDADDDGIPDYLDASAGEEPPVDGGSTNTGGYAGGGLSCGSTGDASSWLLFAFILFVALRRRAGRDDGRGFVSAAGVITALLLAPAASSADEAFTLDQYRATETATDGLALSRPTDLGHLRGSVGFILDYARNPLVYETRLGDPTSRVAVVDNHLVGHLQAAIGLIDRVTFYAGLPVSLLMTGAGGPGIVPADGTLVGDPSVGVRARLLGEADELVGLGAQLTATIPVAGLVSTGQRFTGESTVVFVPRLTGELRFGNAGRITANVGARLRGPANLANLELGPELTLGLGGAITAVPDKVEVLLETYAATSFGGFLVRERTPWEALIGLRFRPHPDWSATLAGGPGLSSGYGTPSYRLLATLAWSPVPPPVTPHLFDAPPPPAPTPAPAAEKKPLLKVENRELDSDGDGLFDASDACPNEPEDKDGFQDDNGCPDLDNDEDGLPDGTDTCPDEAEDRDGFQDEDGCREPDNDRDGLEDERDRCPLDPEDADGFQDDDGCPDADDDADGIIDGLDDCPREAEDKDGFRDEDGCPDTDNDGDTIVDEEDKCPLEAGPRDNNGCPDPDTDGDGIPDRLDNCPTEKGAADNAGCKKKQLVVIRKERIELLDSIYFKTAKDVIESRSNKLLDQVVALLKSHPAIARVRIEGHTDDVGNPEKNKDLSQRRAQSVLRYLVKKGIDPLRLDAQGFGQDKPLVPNDSKKNKAKNRRVEFVVVDAGAGTDVQKQQNDVLEDTID